MGIQYAYCQGWCQQLVRNQPAYHDQPPATTTVINQSVNTRDRTPGAHESEIPMDVNPFILAKAPPKKQAAVF